MRSLLIVIEEEYLSKGIAIALMNYFQSIHTTKNPYEAIKILTNEKIDLIITELDFKTIKANDFLEKLINHTKTVDSIVVLKSTDIKLSSFNSKIKIIVKEKPVSIPNIIDLVQSLKTNYIQSNEGE